jgi:outer membrane receptor protein involved in Fe transport
LALALPGSDNRAAYRQTYVGLYLQDVYNVTAQLQLNLGLRYEFSNLIHEDRGRTAFLVDPARDAEAKLGPLARHNPGRLDLSPRAGISWSPWRTRDTLVSAGFGIFYDQMLEYLVDQRNSSAPFYRVAIEPNLNAAPFFPNAPAAAIAQGTPLLAQVLDPSSIDNPMVLRYNFSVQQPLPAGWGLQAGYVGARGNHLFRNYEVNLLPLPIRREDGSLFFPPYDPSEPDNRVNPAFGGINIMSSDAQSFYNSLQVSARKNLGRGLSLQASYTFAKSVDDASDHALSDTEGITQYGRERKLERSLSSFDLRHRLAINYLYSLPFGSGGPCGSPACWHICLAAGAWVESFPCGPAVPSR